MIIGQMIAKEGFDWYDKGKSWLLSTSSSIIHLVATTKAIESMLNLAAQNKALILGGYRGFAAAISECVPQFGLLMPTLIGTDLIQKI
jgi:hypothetical protein